jgi:hypothetical protein
MEVHFKKAARDSPGPNTVPSDLKVLMMIRQPLPPTSTRSSINNKTLLYSDDTVIGSHCNYLSVTLQPLSHRKIFQILHIPG